MECLYESCNNHPVKSMFAHFARHVLVSQCLESGRNLLDKRHCVLNLYEVVINHVVSMRHHGLSFNLLVAVDSE